MRSGHKFQHVMVPQLSIHVQSCYVIQSVFSILEQCKFSQGRSYGANKPFLKRAERVNMSDALHK